MINANQENIKILKDASAVAIVNWDSNLMGTDLAKYVFTTISSNNDTKLHFIDTGDIQSRKKDIPTLLLLLANIKEKNVLSINENECNALAQSINFSSLYD